MLYYSTHSEGKLPRTLELKTTLISEEVSLEVVVSLEEELSREEELSLEVGALFSVEETLELELESFDSLLQKMTNVINSKQTRRFIIFDLWVVSNLKLRIPFVILNIILY